VLVKLENVRAEPAPKGPMGPVPVPADNLNSPEYSFTKSQPDTTLNEY